MNDFLMQLLGISITVSAVGGIIVLFSPRLNKRFPVYRKRLIWYLLALRLILPFSISFPNPPVTVEIPQIRSIRPSVSLNGESSTPLMGVGSNMSARSSSIEAAQIILLVWLAVASILLIRNLIVYFTFRRKSLRWSLPASSGIMTIYTETASNLCLKKVPHLRISKQVNSPMLAGILKPVILLPCSHYERQELRLILCHELIHFQQKDTGLKFLMLVVKSLHWFNPLVYPIVRQVERDIELACDEKVIQIAGETERKIYGSLILTSAASANNPPLVLTTGFHPGKKLLTERITNIMQNKKRRGGLILLSVAIMVTIFCSMLVAFTSIEGSTPDNNNQTASTSTYATENYALLLALKPHGYENMTINSFRDTVFGDIEKNFEEIHQLLDRADDKLEQMRYVDADSSFILNTLIPLIADNWKVYEYATSWWEDNTNMELYLTRRILDENTLTVGDYNKAVLGALSAADEWSRNADTQTIQDADLLKAGLDDIAAQFSTNSLQLELNAWYGSDIGNMDTIGNQGDSDEVVGPSTAEDVNKILTLQYPDYQDMTVKQYKEVIWEDFSRDDGALSLVYDRVIMDMMTGSVPIALTPEEQTFLQLTLYATVEGNVAENLSRDRDTRRIPWLSIDYFSDSIDYETVIDCDIQYDILKPDKLLVHERDAILAAVLGDIQNYLTEHDGKWGEDPEGEFIQFVNTACEKHSTDDIKLSRSTYRFHHIPPISEY